MKKFMLAFVVMTLLCTSARALEDSPANREKEAERYLSIMTVREMFTDMAELMGKNIPEDKRQAFKDLFTKYFDMPAMEKAMKAGMVQHITADEIKALADFYSSPFGKSAMKKMATCMAELTPTIQQEVMKAQAKARAKANESPIPPKDIE
jgi:hypothetical protein